MGSLSCDTHRVKSDVWPSVDGDLSSEVSYSEQEAIGIVAQEGKELKAGDATGVR